VRNLGGNRSLHIDYTGSDIDLYLVKTVPVPTPLSLLGIGAFWLAARRRRVS
jgi:hypothetical protein